MNDVLELEKKMLDRMEKAGGEDPGEDNSVVRIDNDLRTINIPADLKLLGVESDAGVNRIRFKMPRTYGEFDLSEFDIRINYMNGTDIENGDVYIVEDKEAENDSISFSWLVGRNAVKERGDTQFIVCLKQSDPEGVITKEFNTTVAKLPVLPGLETTGNIAEQNSDFLEKMLKELENVQEIGGSVERYAEDAKRSAEEARQAAWESRNTIEEVKGSYITADGTFQGSAIIKEIPGATVQNQEPPPSPDNPQEIKGIGSNGYFDGEWRQGWINSSNGNAEIIRNNVIHGINKIPCENLDSIQLQYEEVIDYLAVAFYKEDGTFLSSKASNKNVRQFTVQPPIGAKYFIPEVQKDAGITPQTARKIEVLINGKYATQVKTQGKNLFNINSKEFAAGNATYEIYGETIKVISNGNGSSTVFYKLGDVKEYIGRTIYLKCDEIIKSKPNMNTVIVLKSTKNNQTSVKDILSLDEVGKEISVKIPNDLGDANTVTLALYASLGTAYENGNYAIFKNVILSEKPIEEFQSYKSSVSYIPLDSPLYEDDRIYLEDGELWEYRENARVVFDGSTDENWYTQWYENLCAYIGNVEMNVLDNPEIRKIVKCNRFKTYPQNITGNVLRENGIAIEGINEAFSGFFFGIYGLATDVPTWRAWLQQNPLEVVYKLKEPTLKKLGSAEAFNLRTFDGVTYIEVVGSSELGTENTFIVPKNQSGGIMTDAFCTAKRNEINMAEQANLASRISVLEKLAVREG